MPKNVFAEFEPTVYPYRYAAQIQIGQLMGGTPTDQNVAAGWLKSKMGADKDETIKQMVAEIMGSRNVTEDEALKEVDIRRHLNGFRRERCDTCHPDPKEPLCATGTHQLFMEGRHVKAMIKEAASAARAVNNLPARMGATSKGVQGFIAEHVVVVEQVLRLGRLDPVTRKVVDVTEPSGVHQSFPKNAMTKQTGIQYAEYVLDAVLDFTVHTDYDFPREQWATILLTGANQGIGASRSQGYGRFVPTRWERLK